jgi:TolB protein
MNADGSGTHVLCRSEKCGPGMGNLSWSPDGKQILFDTSRYHNGLAWNASTIWVAGATGSHVRQLTQRRCGGCMIDEAPSWSPDGKLIAFGREIFGGHETTGIEVMRADGTHLHRIYSCELGGNACVGEIVAPTWAPDGKAIAYTPAAVRSSGIRLTTLAGKTSTIRTCTGSHCVDAYDFVWSPNGRKLAFLGGDAIWVIGRNGKGMRRIARNAGCCIAWVNVSSLGGRPAPQPAQTPAPKLSGTIAFGLERGNDPDKLEVLGLGSPKAQPRALATSEIGIPSQGAWSPDGSKIAYSAARGFSNSSIYVANRDGTGVRLLVPSGFHLDGATEPAWSPDGRRIAFSIEGAKIGIVPAAGGPVRILTKNGTSPSWSPDGREIVFNRELGPGYALFTIHPDGSGLHRLTKLIGEQGPAVWSPDGKEIAFVWTASWSLQWFSVYLIHPDGTHLRRVSTASVGDGTPAWSADGRYLLLLSGLGDRSTLDVVDVRSGQVSRLRTLPGDAWGLSWSPR